MAMTRCAECGDLISDKAGVCPKCGYPIQAIRNAKIDQQNRLANKQLNKERLLLNALFFLVSFTTGFELFKGDVNVWVWVLYFAVFAIVLWFCLSWIPYVIGFFVHHTQRYWHFTRFSYVVSACLGFVIGGSIGMRM